MTPLCIIYAKEVGRESMNKGCEVFIDCYLATQCGLVNWGKTVDKSTVVLDERCSPDVDMCIHNMCFPLQVGHAR